MPGRVACAILADCLPVSIEPQGAHVFRTQLGCIVKERATRVAADTVSEPVCYGSHCISWRHALQHLFSLLGADTLATATGWGFALSDPVIDILQGGATVCNTPKHYFLLDQGSIDNGWRSVVVDPAPSFLCSAARIGPFRSTAKNFADSQLGYTFTLRRPRPPKSRPHPDTSTHNCICICPQMKPQSQPSTQQHPDFQPTKGPP